jgi:ATP-GRASP peptide maturase of grasp-with-spasm system
MKQEGRVSALSSCGCRDSVDLAMILLLSSGGDASIDVVMDWLRLRRHPFLRINVDDLLEDDFHLSLTPPRLSLRGQDIDLEAIGVVWLRKAGNFQNSTFYKQAEARVDRKSLAHLMREHAATIRSLMALLADKHWLTHPSLLNVNKVEMLVEARKHGLAVPETHILNRKADLARLVENGEYISKSSYETFFLNEPSGTYSMFTKNVTPEQVEAFSEEFFPSLIQRKVEKEYELRIFYLDGDCYTMAIFSQQGGAATEIDFREYDWAHPTRSVPYDLPGEVREGIRRFMTGIGLNCGSIDMIRGKNGVYYFLEVNPTGQFGMTSSPCNYSLFERVAEYLIQHDRRQLQEIRG